MATSKFLIKHFFPFDVYISPLPFNDNDTDVFDVILLTGIISQWLPKALPSLLAQIILNDTNAFTTEKNLTNVRRAERNSLVQTNVISTVVPTLERNLMNVGHVGRNSLAQINSSSTAVLTLERSLTNVVHVEGDSLAQINVTVTVVHVHTPSQYPNDLKRFSWHTHN